MKRLMTYVFSMSLALQPVLAHAVTDLYTPPPPPPPPAPAPAPAPTPNSTINIGSNVGKNSQNAGSAANNAAGAALIATGTALLPNPPTTAQGAMLIALGIIALAQGAHDKNAAGQSANTGAHSVFNNGQTQTNKENPKDYDKGQSAFNTPAIKDALSKINELGYDVNENGVKLPNGKNLPLSTFASAVAMKAAGVDAAVLEKVGEISDKVSAQYSVSSVAAGGGEGGGGGGAANAGNKNEEEADGKFNPFAIGADAKKALMAGKTVNLDGEPIGVAGANIFEMIHQAYQKKRTGEQFMEADDEDRRPASVKAQNVK